MANNIYLTTAWPSVTNRKMAGSEHELYGYYQDLRQRAEYLLVGLTAASIGFFWQVDKPTKIGVNPSTLHVTALLILLLALILALKRLHWEPGIFGIMAEEHNLGDERSNLAAGIALNKGIAVSDTHGILRPPEQLKRIEDIDKELNALRQLREELNKKCQRLYTVRNWLLSAGFLLFLAERIWIPYYK